MRHNLINIRGKLIDLSSQCVMGILNATPDSFYEGSRVQTEKQIADRANQIIQQGGAMIDVGAFSTRPGGKQVTEQEELQRMRHALSIVRREQPEAIVSVDTFRPAVARMSVEEFGADIINDVSEGGITGVANIPLETNDKECPEIFKTMAQLNVPYILMSVKPTLQQMIKSFAQEINLLHSLGVKDIILDPGYGFGKTLQQNYEILNEAEKLQELNMPILVGVSRKSMIYKLLGGNSTTSLNGTTIINTISLLKGANILRVHDVKEAVETIKIVNNTIKPIS